MSSSLKQPESLVIRPVRPADRRRCDAIYEAGRRVAFPWCPPDMFGPGDFDRDSRGEVTWVAERDGTVVGFLTVSPPEHFIHLLFVDPAHHRRGIGGSLLDKALALLGPSTWLKCQSGNMPALAFYRSQGWTVTPGGSNDIGPWSYVSVGPVRDAPA